MDMKPERIYENPCSIMNSTSPAPFSSSWPINGFPAAAVDPHPSSYIGYGDADDHKIPAQPNPSPIMSFDPHTMLDNLSFLEQKIHQVKDAVRAVAVSQERQLHRHDQPGQLSARQQMITADLTCIIIQLISAAGSLLLPSAQSLLDAAAPTINNNDAASAAGSLTNGIDEGSEPVHVDEHDGSGTETEMLAPGSYVVLQLEKEEILAMHAHFCGICGKGFKRDANLRMHMRGHGDEYKTPASLAKPPRAESALPTPPVTRYSCPFVGCKRNREHKKFMPLKTVLCVKNHYKRTHCDKRYACQRCNVKKFSVIADLKTHEKHCGRDRWLCSCGTTFSRKDKLFGHIALFRGHSPAVAVPGGHTDAPEPSELLICEALSDPLKKEDDSGDKPRGRLSPMSFDPCGFDGFNEFGGPVFGDLDNPFTFVQTRDDPRYGRPDACD